MLASLDDVLYGTRALDYRVRTISHRKVDRKGHSADAVADELFRVKFAIRLRRRGEPHDENIRKLLEKHLDGRGRNHC